MSRGRTAAGLALAAVALAGCGSGAGQDAAATSTAPAATTTAAPAPTDDAVVPTPGPDGTFGDLVLGPGELPVPLVRQDVPAQELVDSLAGGTSGAVVDPSDCAGVSPTAPGALDDLGYTVAAAVSTGVTVRELVSTGVRSLDELDAAVSRCTSVTATLGEAQSTTTISPVDPPPTPADAARGYTLELTARAGETEVSRTVRVLVGQVGPVQVVVTGENAADSPPPDAALVDEVFSRSVAKVRTGG